MSNLKRELWQIYGPQHEKPTFMAGGIQASQSDILAALGRAEFDPNADVVDNFSRAEMASRLGIGPAAEGGTLEPTELLTDPFVAQLFADFEIPLPVLYPGLEPGTVHHVKKGRS